MLMSVLLILDKQPLEQQLVGPRESTEGLERGLSNFVESIQLGGCGS